MNSIGNVIGGSGFGLAGTSRPQTATVRLGETSLAQVAQRLGLPEQTLLTANPQLAQSGRITAGQEIRLPQSGATAQAAQAGPHLPSSPAELPPEIRQPVSGSGDPVQKAIIQGRLKDLKPDLYGDLPAVQAFGSFEKLAHEASEEKKWTKSGVNDKIWEFRDHSNRFMVDTNPGDLNRMIKAADKYGTLGDLASSIADRGYKASAPQTYIFANKLEPESWTKLMNSFSQMTPTQRAGFAEAFGDRKLAGNARIADGMQKLVAISIYNAAKAQAMHKANALDGLAKTMDAATHMPGLPEPATKMFEFYSKVTGDLPEKFAESLVKHDQNMFQEGVDEMFGHGMYDEVGIQLWGHLQQVLNPKVF